MDIEVITERIECELKILKSVFSVHQARTRRVSRPSTTIAISDKTKDHLAEVIKFIKEGHTNSSNDNEALAKVIQVIRQECIRIQLETLYVEINEGGRFLARYEKKIDRHAGRNIVLFDAKSSDELRQNSSLFLTESQKAREMAINAVTEEDFDAIKKLIDKCLEMNLEQVKYISNRLHDYAKYHGDKTREITAKWGFALAITTAAIGQAHLALENIKKLLSWIWYEGNIFLQFVQYYVQSIWQKLLILISG